VCATIITLLPNKYPCKRHTIVTIKCFYDYDDAVITDTQIESKKRDIILLSSARYDCHIVSSISSSIIRTRIPRRPKGFPFLWATYEMMPTEASPPSDRSGVDEFRRSRRQLLYIVLVSVFWCLVVFFAYEHENLLVYILLAIFASAVTFLLGSVGWFLLTTPGLLTAGPRQYEMTDTTGLTTTPVGPDGMGGDEAASSGRFEETARRVRSCREAVPPGRTPQDGTYRVVYAAVVYGKQLRSEGRLQLQFTPAAAPHGMGSIHRNGWEISGKSIFGSSSTPILEGFVNAEGHIYWMVPSSNVISWEQNQTTCSVAVLYRGVLDLDSGTLDNGEFQSISLLGASSTLDKKHEGRIVRMEFVGTPDVPRLVNHDVGGRSVKNLTPEVV
jgi:hypothetical protein